MKYKKSEKKILGVSHLEGKLPLEELLYGSSFLAEPYISISEKPCVFVKDCCLSKEYCTVESSISCQTYKFMKKYTTNYLESIKR